MRQTMKLGILGMIACAMLSFAMVTSETKQIDIEARTIEWVGKKITGQHS